MRGVGRVVDGNNKQSGRINCFSCRHFYITYDTRHPYGCRVMKFKSVELPSAVVYKNSSMPCQAYQKKG